MTDTTERTFTLPDLGEGLVEATVLEWLAAPGDRIGRNAPLVELETTKSAVEIPSPYGGTVVRLHAEEGEVVQVGAPLVTFEVERPAGEAPGDRAGATGAAEAAEAAGSGGSAGIVGRVPEEDGAPRRRVRLRPPEE